MPKQTISRDAALAALPDEATAWELHGAIARQATDAMHESLRAEQWLRNHGRKTYDPVEHAARHAKLEAEAKAARKARRLWQRAERASEEALGQIPYTLHKARYTRESWVARMGYRTP